MTDAQPKKRAWFQLHLGTCVVLMFVVAGFLLGNFDVLRLLFEDPDISEMGRTYGFPFTAWRVGEFKERWDLLAAAGNLACFAIVLAVIFRVMEGSVRQAKAGRELRRAGADAPRPRAWFQLHLSTGLLIMVAIGAFLYPNFKPQELVDINENYGVARAFYYVKFGWPFTVAETEWDDRHDLIYKAQLDEKPSEEGVRKGLTINYIFDPDFGPPKYPKNLASILADLPSPYKIPANRWDSHGIVLNLVVLASGLAVLVFGMEWVLRRRDRRAKKLPSPTTE